MYSWVWHELRFSSIMLQFSFQITSEHHRISGVSGLHISCHALLILISELGKEIKPLKALIEGDKSQIQSMFFIQCVRACVRACLPACVRARVCLWPVCVRCVQQCTITMFPVLELPCYYWRRRSGVVLHTVALIIFHTPAQIKSWLNCHT